MCLKSYMNWKSHKQHAVMYGYIKEEDESCKGYSLIMPLSFSCSSVTKL